MKSYEWIHYSAYFGSHGTKPLGKCNVDNKEMFIHIMNPERKKSRKPLIKEPKDMSVKSPFKPLFIVSIMADFSDP